jgi:hypothetical protein
MCSTLHTSSSLYLSFWREKNHSILLYISFGLRNQVGLNNRWLRQPTAMQTVSVSAYLTHLPWWWRQHNPLKCCYSSTILKQHCIPHDCNFKNLAWQNPTTPHGHCGIKKTPNIIWWNTILYSTKWKGVWLSFQQTRWQSRKTTQQQNKCSNCWWLYLPVSFHSKQLTQPLCPSSSFSKPSLWTKSSVTCNFCWSLWFMVP